MQCCVKVVWMLPKSCFKVVSKFSQCCPNVVIKLREICPKTITKLSLSCQKIVLKLAQKVFQNFPKGVGDFPMLSPSGAQVIPPNGTKTVPEWYPSNVHIIPSDVQVVQSVVLPYPADLYCSFWSLYLSAVFHNKSTMINKKEIQPGNYLCKVASIRSIFERDELSACSGLNSFGSMLLLRTCGIWKGGAGGCLVTNRPGWL